MPRRTKAELKLAFKNLVPVFLAISAFQKTEMRVIGAYPDEWSSMEKMLDMVAGGKMTMSGLLNTIQIEINDFQLGLQDFDPQTYPLLTPQERGPNADRFFAYYRARTGRAFYQDVTPPEKIAKQILRRGAITTRFEHHVAVEILNDVSQQILSSNERTNLEEMIAAFERAQ